MVAVDTVGEKPNRFHERANVFVIRPGDTPGTMETDDRGEILASGSIRRLWKQLVNPIPAPPPVEVSAMPFTGQRAIRYKASTTYRPAGDQLAFSRGGRPGMHTVITQATRQPRPTLGVGLNRNRPVLRNRIASFGSRVPPLNSALSGAVGGGGGGGGIGG